MEEKIRLTLLFDFYGELLTKHQQEVLRDYVEEDFTVSEIASDRGISRQAASDLIKRSTKSLEDYESKLHLVKKFLDIRSQVLDIQSKADAYKDYIPKEFDENLMSFFTNVLEDL